MEQLDLRLPKEEVNALKSVVRRSISITKKKYPKPVNGESLEEYHDFINTEILLEISEQIKEIALKRQKDNIDYLWKGVNN